MLIPILVFAVLAIVLVVTLYKSAANWSWVPIVALVLIFFTSIFAGIVASRTLKTRAAWLKKDLENERLATEALTQRDSALYGPADSIAWTDDSLLGKNHQLNLISIGEGRIWRNGQPTVQGDQIDVAFSPPADGSMATSPASQLKQDMQVFAFAEQGATIDGTLVTVPVQFLGTYLVQSVNNDVVTMRPLFVTNFSTAEAAAPTTSWTLFEKMPGDYPAAFSEDMEMAEFDISAFRDALRTKYLTAESVGLAPESKEYEALLDEFTFDGLSMNVIQNWIDTQQGRINDQFDPPDTDKNTLVRFTARSGAFEVDGSANPVTDGVFDPDGLANDPNLHIGSDVTFNQDDELLASTEYIEMGFDLADGNPQPPMVDSEPAEVIVQYYARPLRDYPFALKELNSQAKRMQEVIDEMKADIEVSQAMIESTANQISTRDALTAKLQSDISRRQQELSEVTAFGEQLEQEVARRQQQISTYYEQILELYNQLKNQPRMKDTRTAPGTPSIAADQR